MFIILVPQSFIITFSFRWLNNYGDFYRILIGWFKLSVQTIQPHIVKSYNFVYNHWGHTSIYRPMSYSFSSLTRIRFYILITNMIFVMLFIV